MLRGCNRHLKFSQYTVNSSLFIVHKIDYGKQSVLLDDSDDNDVGGYYGNYVGYGYQATGGGDDDDEERSSNDSEADNDDDVSHSNDNDDDLSSTVDNLTV